MALTLPVGFSRIAPPKNSMLHPKSRPERLSRSTLSITAQSTFLPGCAGPCGRPLSPALAGIQPISTLRHRPRFAAPDCSRLLPAPQQLSSLRLGISLPLPWLVSVDLPLVPSFRERLAASFRPSAERNGYVWPPAYMPRAVGGSMNPAHRFGVRISGSSAPQTMRPSLRTARRRRTAAACTLRWPDSGR